jgi:hypothetical protein
MKRFPGKIKKALLGWWSDYQLPIILLAGLGSLVLGFIGFTKHGLAAGQDRAFLDNLYLTLALLSMNTGAVDPPVPIELELARFLVPFLTAYTAVFALASVFSQQVRLIGLNYYRDHIIICGLGRKGIRLANQFAAQGQKVVVIEGMESNTWIGSVRRAGILVLTGDATDPELLRRVRLNRARYLIAVTGSDGINAEIAVTAQQVSSRRERGVLTCIIHIVDPRLWNLLRDKELYVDPASNFRLQLFNIYDHGARLLLQRHSPGLQQGTNGTSRHHLLIIGLGKLGEALIVQAALKWQQHGLAGQKLQISIIDLAAQDKVRSLMLRYQHLGEICDFEPYDLNVNSSDFFQADFLTNPDSSLKVSAIYVCMDDDPLVLHSGLVLYNKVRDAGIPVVVRMVEDAGLASLVQPEEHLMNNYRSLHAFPFLDLTCTPELVLLGTHEIIARALHASYLQSVQDQPGKEWEQLPEETREWNRKQADRISLILERNGYRIAPLSNWKAADLTFEETPEKDEVGIMACMEHELWSQEMQAAGWQHAPTRSRDRKTNPNLVQWDQLPVTEVEKNKRFIRQLPCILAMAGFQIEPKNSVAG